MEAIVLKHYIAQFGDLPEATRISILKRTLAVFAVFGVIAGIAVWRSHTGEQKAARLQFNSITDKAVTSLQENMGAYEQVLHGGVALFKAVGPVSRRQWETYVTGLKLSETYPGLQAVGYATVYDFAKVDELEKSVRAEGLQGFTIRPKEKGELNTAILYIEPLDWRNRRALGYDMYSSAVRRDAMKRAMETGKPALSAPVKLMQETEKGVQRGILLYLRVKGQRFDRPDSNDNNDRISGVNGFVYSAFRMGDLMSRILSRTDEFSSNAVRIQIFDGSEADKEDLLFDSAGGAQAVETWRPAYTEKRQVAFYGRTWHVRFSSLAEFERQSSSFLPWLTALGGAALAFIAAGLFGFVNTGKEIAHSTADKLAAQVDSRKRAQEETRIALRELSHRVKNTLTIVTSIASQTVRHSSDLEEFDSKFRERLLGLSRVHDLLTAGRTYTTSLSEMAAEVLKPYHGDNNDAVSLQGEDLELAPTIAIMLSMLFNELATNATKYGAWSDRNGSVTLAWHVEDVAPAAGSKTPGKQLELIWRERGGPPVKPPTRKGFGSHVIKFSIERSLGGKVDASFETAGVSYVIKIPWAG